MFNFFPPNLLVLPLLFWPSYLSLPSPVSALFPFPLFFFFLFFLSFLSYLLDTCVVLRGSVNRVQFNYARSPFPTLPSSPSPLFPPALLIHSHSHNPSPHPPSSSLINSLLPYSYIHLLQILFFIPPSSSPLSYFMFPSFPLLELKMTF